MARIRTIKPTFWSSLTIGKLSSDARLTFIGLWNYADDSGRAIDDVRLIKAAVWPLDDRANLKRIAQWLIEIEKLGLILRYKVNDIGYFQVSTWAEHQRVEKPRVSTLPPPSFPDPSPTPPGNVLEPSGPRARVLGKGMERKGEGGENGRSLPDASLVLPAGLSNHPAVVLYWQRFHPQDLPPIGTQEKIENVIGSDLVGWAAVFDFWQDNNYRPESIGRMLSKYAEDKAKGPTRLVELTPQGNPKITAPG